MPCAAIMSRTLFKDWVRQNVADGKTGLRWFTAAPQESAPVGQQQIRQAAAKRRIREGFGAANSPHVYTVLIKKPKPSRSIPSR